jgi:hypothetical protein
MGIMRPEISESALRGQDQSGFWPLDCPSGVQVNLHFATRSTYCQEDLLYGSSQAQFISKAIPARPCDTIPSEHYCCPISLLGFHKRFQYG